MSRVVLPRAARGVYRQPRCPTCRWTLMFEFKMRRWVPKCWNFRCERFGERVRDAEAIWR